MRLTLAAAVTISLLKLLIADDKAFQGSSSCATCFFPTRHTSKPSECKTLDFSNRSLYFFGDSTLRQIYGEFLAAAGQTEVMEFDELKEHARHGPECNQQQRTSYVPPPHDPTPCYVNEQTCSNHFESGSFGSNVSVTFDWKHFIYEDYDRQLLSRWTGTSAPSLLFISPGLHDCFHEPHDLEHHRRQLHHLAAHLNLLDVTVVWVDMNPFHREKKDNFDGFGTLPCSLHINDVAHQLAAEYDFYLFSRQSLIMSLNQVNDADEYPVHQPDDIIKTEYEYLRSWLSCVL